MYSPRDLATWDGDYPMLVVTAPQEDGQGWAHRCAAVQCHNDAACSGARTAGR